MKSPFKIIKFDILLVNQNKRPFAVARSRFSFTEATDDGPQTTNDSSY